MKIVIIGGGSSGTTCAFELRKLDKDVEITIIEKTSNLEYSPCALPYVLSGEIESFDDIFIFKKEDYEQNNIRLMLNSEVKNIDRAIKKITLSDNTQMNYDKLVIATGSDCFVPPIKGLEDADFKVIKTIEDAKRISEALSKNEKSVIIGAGMIGIELAVSLASKGVMVSIVEVKEHILPALIDEDMAKELEDYLEGRGIKIFTNNRVEEILENKLLLNGNELLFDRLFLCSGVKPNLMLAKNAGLKVDKGIVVNKFLQSSDENIFASGDCVESFEFGSGKKIFSQLGTTAVRQAKTIAKNILGGKEKFHQVLNNTISKIGDLYIGSVGITKKRAAELGIKTISAKYTSALRAEYYPSKERITVKLLCDESGIIIGGQIIGHNEVVGRLDLIALSIQKRITVQELANLETCYNPASAPVFDPVTITAGLCLKKLNILERQ